MEDDIFLEEYTDDAFINSMSKKMTYPFLELGDVSTTEEFEFFKNRSAGENALPLYTKVEGVLCRMGSLSLELDALLVLRHVYDYPLFLHKSANECVEIDLNTPESLTRFIKL